MFLTDTSSLHTPICITLIDLLLQGFMTDNKKSVCLSAEPYVAHTDHNQAKEVERNKLFEFCLRYVINEFQKAKTN